VIDREQIEALDRQSGCAGEVPARFIRAEVPRTDGLRITGWIPLEHVDLVANLSASDWQAGLDGALLRVTDGVPHDHLQVRQTRAALGEPIWLYGYPYATNRASISCRMPTASVGTAAARSSMRGDRYWGTIGTFTAKPRKRA
jgi:hypothetical protein